MNYNSKIENDYLIPQIDFERIFQIIHSVYYSVENNTTPNCMFYNLAGSFILNCKYNIKAKPLIGGACFTLEQNPSHPLLLGLFIDNKLTSDNHNFHCWIDTEDFMLDFTSPLYREYVKNAGGNYSVPRKMLQKRYNKMNSNLSNVGDFILNPNKELTKEKIEEGLKNNIVIDLINICVEWFVKPPAEINKIFPIIDKDRKVKNFKLQEIKIMGSW